jgi:hypothetical protein
MEKIGKYRVVRELGKGATATDTSVMTRIPIARSPSR